MNNIEKTADGIIFLAYLQASKDQDIIKRIFESNSNRSFLLKQKETNLNEFYSSFEDYHLSQLLSDLKDVFNEYNLPYIIDKKKSDILNCILNSLVDTINTFWENEYINFDIDKLDDPLLPEDIDTEIKLPYFKKLVDVIVLINRLSFIDTFLHNEQKQNTTIKGFNTKLTEEQIETLYEKMQGNYFDTSLENFKNMFNQKLIDFTPIKKTKKLTNTLLIYFTSELFQKDNPNDYVKITEYCFDVSGLSQAQTNTFNYNKTNKPSGFESIDEIIKSL